MLPRTGECNGEETEELVRPVKQFIHLVVRARPKVAVMENVKRFLSGQHELPLRPRGALLYLDKIRYWMESLV